VLDAVAVSSHNAGGMPPALAEPEEQLLAGLDGRLPRAPVSFAYSVGLVVVSVAMIILPLLYLGLIAASAWVTVWWGVHGLGLVTSGSVASIKIRLFAYAAPLIAGGAVPIFLVKPLFTRRASPPDPLYVTRRDEPMLFAFIERLAATVGAPVPDRVSVDCEVNAGAGLELGLLRREGSSLVLNIGLPLVAGLTLPQLAGVLAHEFGHFGQGTGMRLGRVIRGVNDWFDRVAHERDDWDESLHQGTQEGGGWGLLYVGAQIMVALGRKILFGLMVVGHAVSCFLSRQMEFDADYYEAGVAGSAVFADTSFRLRVLTAAARFVMTSLDRERLVNDLPGLIARVADHAPPRLMTEIRMDVQRSGTRLFDTHPADLERLRRARAARFPGLLKNTGPASALFRNFPAVCARATQAFYERALGHDAPHADALLPVDAFIAPPSPPDAKPKASKLEFPPERSPRLAAHVAPTHGGAESLGAARTQWRAAAPPAAAAMERFRRGYAQWLDAGLAEALFAAGMTVRPQEFSLPAATAEGIERTRQRGLTMQSEAAPAVEAAERALGERVGLAARTLGAGVPTLSDAAELHNEAQRLLGRLPAFEKAQADAAWLRAEAVVLDCLLGNQKNRIGHAGLDQEIDRRLPEVRRALAAVRADLETIALPGPDWDIPPPWHDDPTSHLRSARRALEVLDAQHARAVARLVQIADRVEGATLTSS
jgi:Zn-dependent protease with chaperone function